jgi:hypothetical protein
MQYFYIPTTEIQYNKATKQEVLSDELAHLEPVM